jgi:glycosyltransferase involved in cell wall biosynthesis
MTIARASVTETPPQQRSSGGGGSNAAPGIERRVNRPRTAVLMPVFNPDRDDLARTLDSLAAQTEPADVVIVDDGSAPPVSGLCAVGDIVVLRLPRNQGITAALNHGLQHIATSGYQYVARMDCGDVCAPDRIAKQQDFMERHPEIDLLGAFAEVVDEHGQHLFFEGISGGPAPIRRKLLDNAAFKHPTFFFRTRAVERLGNYSNDYPCAEDYEFMCRLSAHGALDCLDEVLVRYYKSASGLSNRRRQVQLRSRLRVQLHYLAPTSPLAWLGVLRTCVTLVVPKGIWALISRHYWQRRNFSGGVR